MNSYGVEVGQVDVQRIRDNSVASRCAMTVPCGQEWDAVLRSNFDLVVPSSDI